VARQRHSSFLEIIAIEFVPRRCEVTKVTMVRLAALFAQGGGIAGSAPILMMVAIFAIFYLLLIMPQQRRQKKWQAMLSQVKSGDRVVTSGGLTGMIMSVKDDVVVLRLPPDNIKVEVTRASIVTLTTNESEKS
jgi:preprotein translocase subunit YajC